MSREADGTMAGRLFLGVDGGGTKTRTRIRDESGALLGEGHAGPGNARLGEVSFRNIVEAAQAAAKAAGMGEADLAKLHAGMGLAGTQQDSDRQSVLDRPFPFASISVDTDAYCSYLGAFRGEDGAILILGTGSGGLAMVKGKRLNVGGWGADIADEGSGQSIGNTVIRRALWAFEGMAPWTPLGESVMKDFADQPQNAVIWAGTATPGDFAAYAPRVFEFARRGDPLGVWVLKDCAADAAMLIRRLNTLGAPQVAMIGGIFPHLLPWLPDDVKAYLTEPAGDALDGAIQMAERALRGIGTGRP